MILHNLRVAIRNLMRYKVQTLVSVLSIAIGIVTLAFVHAAMSDYKFSALLDQPYYERAYNIGFSPLEESEPQANGCETGSCDITPDIVRALKPEGGLRCAEQVTVLADMIEGTISTEFHLCDSTVRKTLLIGNMVDPGLPNYLGLRSAITGEKIKPLKPGEAIISKREAAQIFGDANPIGATQESPLHRQPGQITIVDVFDTPSCFDHWFTRPALYYTFGPIEQFGSGNANERWEISLVLKDGFTRQQLQTELDAHVKPLGLKSVLTKEADRMSETNAQIILTNTLAHIAGSLILVAAIVGFLRMQVQLFWMRKREVALRITHGARMRHLFWLFFTETCLTVALSVVVAILTGKWLERIVYTGLAYVSDLPEMSVPLVRLYSLHIGLGLLLICGLGVWVAVRRISASGSGLAANLRGSRTHLFRNAMLCLQVTVCTVFVCGNLIVLSWSREMLSYYNLPANDDFYRKCILMNMVMSGKRKQLMEEVRHLPSLDKVIPQGISYLSFRELDDNPDMLAALNGRYYQPFYLESDTALLSFYGVRVNWIRRPADEGAYLLLDEDIYQKFRATESLGNGTLSVDPYGKGFRSVPIAGTIPKFPYSDHGVSVLVNHETTASFQDYVLVPKAGRYGSLMQEVEQAIRRIEPEVVEPIATNLRDSQSEITTMVEGMRTLGWMLGFVSLVICAMGIYSTISLDTRSRQQEVAIRKVCGAKGRDIYILFGRIYLAVIVVALSIAIPVSVLFNRAMIDLDTRTSECGTLSPFMPCLVGSSFIVTLIASIVVWEIRKVMQVGRTSSESSS